MVEVACPKGCPCEPWVCLRCIQCEELWYRQTFRWRKRRESLCHLCYSKEIKATQRAIKILLATGREDHGSYRLFELLEKGVSGNLGKPAELIRAECA